MADQTMKAKPLDSAPAQTPRQPVSEGGGPIDGAENSVGLRYMPVALAVAATLMAGKFYAYWITGSSAILSDALESIINVVAAAFSLGSLMVSARPPDDSHPYGHGKIEFFAAGFEGALIILAAVGIFFEGLKQLMDARELPHLDSGLAIVLAVSLVNLVLGWVLVRAGKRSNSLVLEAHGRHVLTDVWSSLGVVIGLGLVYFTSTYWLDGAVACAVGLNIIVMGSALVRRAFGGLMDASDPALLEEICTLLRRHRTEVWIDVHRLRAWRSGPRVHVDFHLILPRDLPLDDGHKQVKLLERIFGDHFNGQSEVLIHLDPCSDPECPVCVNDPCDLRSGERVGPRDWHLRSLTEDSPNGAGRQTT